MRITASEYAVACRVWHSQRVELLQRNPKEVLGALNRFSSIDPTDEVHEQS